MLYNNKGYHSMPTYLNVLNNAILRANLPPSKGNPAAYGMEKGCIAAFNDYIAIKSLAYDATIHLCVCVCVCVYVFL